MYKVSDYNGKPVIVLSTGENDKYPFTFGIKKAKMILEHIADIQAFVKENE